ncbi:MAG: hypothetical protein AAGE52_38140 [Myxococcota bacterium]
MPRPVPSYSHRCAAALAQRLLRAEDEFARGRLGADAVKRVVARIDELLLAMPNQRLAEARSRVYARIAPKPVEFAIGSFRVTVPSVRLSTVPLARRPPSTRPPRDRRHSLAANPSQRSPARANQQRARIPPVPPLSEDTLRLYSRLSRS